VRVLHHLEESSGRVDLGTAGRRETVSKKPDDLAARGILVVIELVFAALFLVGLVVMISLE
jgi:hypothetical protein